MATMNGSARPATSVTGILDSVSDVIEGGRVAPRPNPEVVARAKRRTYTGEYKQQILTEADVARGSSSDGSIGLHTVVPPSIHETGELVRFEEGFDRTPANIDADVLTSAVRKVAAAALLARHWPTRGSRHQAFLALAGVFARAESSLEEAKPFTASSTDASGQGILNYAQQTSKCNPRSRSIRPVAR